MMDNRLDDIFKEISEMVYAGNDAMQEKIDGLERSIRILIEENTQLSLKVHCLEAIAQGKTIHATTDSILIGNTRYLNGSRL